MKKILLLALLALNVNAAQKLVSTLPVTNVIYLTNYVMVVLQTNLSNVTVLVPWSSVVTSTPNASLSDLVWTNATGVASNTSSTGSSIQTGIATNAGIVVTSTGSNALMLSTGGSVTEIASGLFGGLGNNIDTGSGFSVISAGSFNEISTNSASSFIGGGDHNLIAGGSSSGIIGGARNTDFGQPYNFIGGGGDNLITVNVGWSGIIAGDTCTIDGVAGGDYETILGGSLNVTTSPGKNFMNVWGGEKNNASASKSWVIGFHSTNLIPNSVFMAFTNNGVSVQPSTLAMTYTTNEVTFGSTNVAPTINASTPVAWISVLVSGRTNAYRLPIYE